MKKSMPPNTQEKDVCGREPGIIYKFKMLPDGRVDIDLESGQLSEFSYIDEDAAATAYLKKARRAKKSKAKGK